MGRGQFSVNLGCPLNLQAKKYGNCKFRVPKRLDLQTVKQLQNLNLQFGKRELPSLPENRF